MKGSDSWRSGLSSGRHAGGQRFEVGKLLFCKNAENAVKINNSPRFTAFTAKRCKKYAVKIIFFHRISPHFLRKFTAKPRPGWASLARHFKCTVSIFQGISLLSIRRAFVCCVHCGLHNPGRGIWPKLCKISGN